MMEHTLRLGIDIGVTLMIGSTLGAGRGVIGAGGGST